MDAELVRKAYNFYKILNFATTNATLMKLTTIMYLHETFHLAKKLVRSSWGQESVNEKPLKMS